MKRFRIDRIDVDMRGVPPATARAAARELGAAIQRRMGADDSRAGPQMTRTPMQANALADRAAHQVVRRLGRQR